MTGGYTSVHCGLICGLFRLQPKVDVPTREQWALASDSLSEGAISELVGFSYPRDSLSARGIVGIIGGWAF